MSNSAATPTPETTQLEVVALEATIAALSTQVAVGAPTEGLSERERSAMIPLAATAVDLTVPVTPEALQNGETAAEAAAERELCRLLEGYIESECRVGFALISGNGRDIADGIAVADTVEQLLRRELPELFGDAVVELFAFPGEEPLGQVSLQLFFYQGCNPDAPGSMATP